MVKIIELGDKVSIDSEGFVGKAYVRNWSGSSVLVSVDRFGKEFLVSNQNIVELR